MKIKIKLLASWTQALHDAYAVHIETFDPASQHDQLLFEHAYLFYLRLADQIRKDQRQYTITLTSTEALAFFQFWQETPLIAGSLEYVVVSEIIKRIDQASKQPKRLITS